MRMTDRQPPAAERKRLFCPAELLLDFILGILHSPQLFLYGLWLFLRMVKLRLRD